MDLAKQHRPKLLFCGGTAIPRTIDFPAFAEIAKEVDALLVADIAHIAGLIAGGAHPSPVGHAPVISTTTHKTLRGPRGAMLMADEAHGEALDKAVFPGLQGGPHDHTTAAIAVALKEASTPDFKAYAAQIVKNAKALAEELLARGFDLVSGGTDNHLILVDLTNKDIPGKRAAKALDRAGIELNYNTVPFDPRKPFSPSGIRLGTPAITSRGMGEAEMTHVARFIDEADRGRQGEGRGRDRRDLRRGEGADGRLPGPRTSIVRLRGARRSLYRDATRWSDGSPTSARRASGVQDLRPTGGPRRSSRNGSPLSV